MGGGNTMALESSITGAILDYINGLPECRAEKLKGGSSASGRADINACYQGRSLRIEVKTPDHRNTTSRKQEHNLEKWYRAGSAVMVVYSKEAVEVFLPHLKHKQGVYLTRAERNGCTSWAKIPSLK